MAACSRGCRVPLRLAPPVTPHRRSPPSTACGWVMAREPNEATRREANDEIWGKTHLSGLCLRMGADGGMKYLQIPTTIWSQLMAHLTAGYCCFSSVIKDVLFIPMPFLGLTWRASVASALSSPGTCDPPASRGHRSFRPELRLAASITFQATD